MPCCFRRPCIWGRAKPPGAGQLRAAASQRQAENPSFLRHTRGAAIADLAAGPGLQQVPGGPVPVPTDAAAGH